MTGQCRSSSNNHLALADVHHDGRLKSSSSSSTIARTTATSHGGDSVTTSSDAATHLNRTLCQGTTSHGRHACRHPQTICTNYESRRPSDCVSEFKFQNLNGVPVNDWSLIQQNSLGTTQNVIHGEILTDENENHVRHGHSGDRRSMTEPKSALPNANVGSKSHDASQSRLLCGCGQHDVPPYVNQEHATNHIPVSSSPILNDVPERPFENEKPLELDSRMIDFTQSEQRLYVNSQDEHVSGTGREITTPMSQHGQIDFQNLNENPVLDPEQDQEFRIENEGDEKRSKKTCGTTNSAEMEKNLKLTIPKVLACSVGSPPIEAGQQRCPNDILELSCGCDVAEGHPFSVQPQHQQPPGSPIHQHQPQSPSAYHQNPLPPRSPCDLHPHSRRSPGDQQSQPLRFLGNQDRHTVRCPCHKHRQPPISPDHHAQPHRFPTDYHSQPPRPFAQCQASILSLHQPPFPTSPGNQCVPPKSGEDKPMPPTEQEVPPKSPPRCQAIQQLPSVMNQKFNRRHSTESKQREQSERSQSSIEMEEPPPELLPEGAPTNYRPIGAVGAPDPNHPAVSSGNERHCAVHDYDLADTCGFRAVHAELLPHSRLQAEGNQSSERPTHEIHIHNRSISGSLVKQQEGGDISDSAIQPGSPGATTEQPVHPRAGNSGDEETDAIPIPSPTTLEEIPESARPFSVTQTLLLETSESVFRSEAAQRQLPDTSQSGLRYEDSDDERNDSAQQAVPRPIYPDDLENYPTSPNNEYANDIQPVSMASTYSENSGVLRFQNPDTVQDNISLA